MYLGSLLMQFRPVLSALSCATSRTASLIPASVSASASASPLSLRRYSSSLLTGAVNTRSTAAAATTSTTATAKSQLPKIRFANTVGKMEKVDTSARLSQLRKLMDANKVDVYSRSTTSHASHPPFPSPPLFPRTSTAGSLSNM